MINLFKRSDFISSDLFLISIIIFITEKSDGLFEIGGWSGGAKMLHKLSVPGRPTNLKNSRARAYCACSRCGWGLFGHFFSRLSFLFSFSISGRRPDID